MAREPISRSKKENLAREGYAYRYDKIMRLHVVTERWTGKVRKFRTTAGLMRWRGWAVDRDEDDGYNNARAQCLSNKSHAHSEDSEAIEAPDAELCAALAALGYTDPRWLRVGFEGMLEWRMLSVLDADGQECRAWVYPHSAAADVAADEVEFTRGPWDSLGRLRNP